MSFQNAASCFFTFCSSDQCLLLFTFKSFTLNTSLFIFYITLYNLYSYAWLQHGRITKCMVDASVTDVNYCRGAYLIVLVIRCSDYNSWPSAKICTKLEMADQFRECSAI